MSSATPLLEVRPGPHDLVVEQVPDRSLRMDREGRWCTYRQGPVFYRRTWDGAVVRRVGSRAVALEPAHARRVHADVQEQVQALLTLAERQPERIRFHAEPADVARLQQRLAPALEWAADRFEAQARQYREAYPEDTRVLPPDRYHDLLLLPALGCPHGRCVFCTLFSEPAFRVLSADEFEQHLVRVADLLGSNQYTRPGIFLGSASALSLSQARLRKVLHQVRARFGAPPQGVAAFLDPDHAPSRTVAEYRALQEAGLRHVTIGLETGDPSLRESLGKSGDLARVEQVAAQVREAGLVVGLTLLVGAGGEGSRSQHRAQTFEVARRMDLSRQDRWYLSPLEGSLDAAALEQEVGAWRDELRAVTAAQVVPYRLALFRHYA